MKIVIIEDEIPAAEKLEKMIRQHDEQHDIQKKLRSVEGAVAWFSDHPLPDLLFMDIHLLDGTCFELLKQIELTCPVIFTTAYDRYALEAFQLHSIDYLLKPISYDKLAQAFEKLASLQENLRQEQQQSIDKVVQALESKKPSYKSRFLVKSGSRLFSVPIEAIAYFFSKDRITFICTQKDKKYSVNHSLDEIEELLDPSLFFRINRQMILHINSVQMVHKYFKGRLKVDLIPPSEEDAFVSSRRVGDFQDWLDQ